MTKALLFDFFGTLVDYRPSAALTFQRTFQQVQQIGFTGSYDDLMGSWHAVYADLNTASLRTLHEFSMREAAQELSRRPDMEGRPGFADTFIPIYLNEWDAGVVYKPGLRDYLALLAGQFKLAVVSNTHETQLVQSHLDAMQIRPLFSLVLTSVDFRTLQYSMKRWRGWNSIGTKPSTSGTMWSTTIGEPARPGCAVYLSTLERNTTSPRRTELRMCSTCLSALR